MELGELEPGARFRFLAFPEQTATLVEKGQGRALIRYDRRATPTHTFEARDPKTGELVRKTIATKLPELEPCALGAQVVPVGDEPEQAA